MSKSQKRGNREPKKPKAIKAPAEAATPIGVPSKQAPGRPPSDSKKR